MLFRAVLCPQPVLSSPFPYRLLYKTHKRLNSQFLRVLFRSLKFVGNVINIAEQTFNLGFIYPRFCVSYPREYGPRLVSAIPVHYPPAGFSWGPDEALVAGPCAAFFGTCHRVTCGRDFGSVPRTCRACASIWYSRNKWHRRTAVRMLARLSLYLASNVDGATVVKPGAATSLIRSGTILRRSINGRPAWKLSCERS